MLATPIQQMLKEALAHHQAGRLLQAQKFYEQILRQQPEHPIALHYTGLLAHQSGDNERAADFMRRSIALKPLLPDFHYNLAQVYRASTRWPEAEASYRKAVELKPDYADAHNGLGLSLQEQGQVEESIASYSAAISLNPGLADAWSGLGSAFKDRGRRDDAIQCCRKAASLRPDVPELCCNLGLVLKDAGQWTEAIACFRKAIDIGPRHAAAYNDLGNSLQAIGRPEEAIACYRKAMEVQPDDPPAHSNLLLAMHYQAECDPAAIFGEHLEFARRHAAPLHDQLRPHMHPRDPETKIRIGYVSTDFRHHAVSFFIDGLLEHHDRQQFEVFCYADSRQEDAVTKRLRRRADRWRIIADQPDAMVADQIREDRIAILLDLVGHAGGGRPLLYARKPAPIQVIYLGYPDTSGIPAVDYRLTDAVADPPGISDPFYVERLIRLPGTFVCYSPSAEAPEVMPLPADQLGYVTFGSFSNFAKVTPLALTTWARILAAVGGSRLVLKDKAFGDEQIRRAVRETFAARGIAADRIELLATIPLYPEHLRAYQRVDIGLDAFPYNGTTTTCEALWMGVPVVGLEGRTHAARVGLSLLSGIGLPELIGPDVQGYVRIAVQLAGDMPRLRQLRQGMRQRMKQSPLMDAARFTRHAEDAFRTMWRRWCAGDE